MIIAIFLIYHPENLGGYCSIIDIIRQLNNSDVGESQQPWSNRLFSKSIKGKILNFSHEVEKMISTISVQV